MIRVRFTTLVFFVCVLSSSAAAAVRYRAVVPLIDIDGDAPDARGAQLRSSLLGGLASAGFDLVPEADLKRKLEAAPDLASCTTTACLRGIGALVGARWVLAARIEATGSTFRTDVRVVDADTGKVAAEASSTCQVCTDEEARDSVSNVAFDLKAKLDELLAPPSARPEPAPRPEPVVPVVERSPKATWALRGTGIAAGVLGLGGIIFGAVEAGRHGSRACEPQSGFLDCPDRRDTTGGQIFGFVTGGVLLVGAAALSYYGWRTPRPGVAIAPAIGRRFVGLSVSSTF